MDKKRARGQEVGHIFKALEALMARPVLELDEIEVTVKELRAAISLSRPHQRTLVKYEALIKLAAATYKPATPCDPMHAALAQNAQATLDQMQAAFSAQQAQNAKQAKLMQMQYDQLSSQNNALMLQLTAQTKAHAAALAQDQVQAQAQAQAQANPAGQSLPPGQAQAQLPYSSPFQQQPPGQAQVQPPYASPFQALPPQYPSQYPSPPPYTQYPAGYPAGGHPAAGYPAAGYPAGGHPAAGYPAAGYQAAGYPAGGFPTGGYPAGYPGGYTANYPPTTPYPAVASSSSTQAQVLLSERRGALLAESQAIAAASVASELAKIDQALK